MDAATRAKWDPAAGPFDLMRGRGQARRGAPANPDIFPARHRKTKMS